MELIHHKRDVVNRSRKCISKCMSTRCTVVEPYCLITVSCQPLLFGQFCTTHINYALV